MRQNRMRNAEKIGYVLLLLAFVVLSVRSFYGFCWSDESFYLSSVHRLYQGDRMFIDEWNPAQFYAVLILPFYRLYLILAGSTDGIYLAARILSNVIILGVAVYFFRVLCKRYSAVSALICAYFYLFFSRSYVDGLSYHNLTLAFALFGISVIFDVFVCGGKRQNLKLFLCGISLGFTVVCNPYQAAAYFLASLAAGIFYGRTHGFKKLGILWAGTIFAALCYLLWLFGRQGIVDTVKSLSNTFHDTDHGGLKVAWRRFKSWFRYQTDHYGRGIGMTMFLWLTAVVRRIFAKGKASDAVRVFILSADTVVLGYNVTIGIDIAGGVFISLMLYGSVLFLLLDKGFADAVTPLLVFYIPGVVISGLQHIASNTWLEAIPVGLVITAAACVVWGELLMEEMAGTAGDRKAGNFLGKMILCTAGAACVLLTVISRVKWVYRDDKLVNLTKRIDEGPAKGVYTSEEHYEQYRNVYRTICGIETDNPKQKRIFCSKLAPWVYLCTDMRCGAYQTWRTPVDDERLMEYYEIQGYLPDYVLVLDEEYGSYVTDCITKTDHCIDANANSFEGYFSDILTNPANYEKVRVGCGYLYQKAPSED